MSFKKSIEIAKGRSLSDRLQMSTSPKTVANPYKKSVKKTKKSRGMRKSVTVIENGIRKARRIKKFADSYYVGLSYLGLLELDLYDKKYTNGVEYGGRYGHDRYDTNYSEYVYRGAIDKETPAGLIHCSVFVHIGQDVYREGERRRNDYYEYDENGNMMRDENGEPLLPDRETVNMWNENTEGITQVVCWGSISYSIADYKNSDYAKTLYESELKGYSSVEDLLDAITKESEVAWGEVTIALNDFQDARNAYNSMESYYPDTITLNAPNSEQIELEKGSEGFWSYDDTRYYRDPLFSEENINMTFDIDIIAVDDESRGYYESRDRNKIPLYYKVNVIGKITDKNTQTSASRGAYRPDEWERRFTGEGAETLEGAIAIAESNIAEVYQEWQEYIASNRNYVESANGRGYQHTTVNTEPWDYNYGDTYEDDRYEDWQSENSYADGEWESSESGPFVFRDEYFGTNCHFETYDYDNAYGNGGIFFYPSKYNDDKRNAVMQEFIQNRTREDVERVCAMTSCSLVDYLDPVTFTIVPNKKIKLSAKKSKMKKYRVSKMRNFKEWTRDMIVPRLRNEARVECIELRDGYRSDECILVLRVIDDGVTTADGDSAFDTIVDKCYEVVDSTRGISSAGFQDVVDDKTFLWSIYDDRQDANYEDDY